MKALIVDDEVKLADALAELFRQHKILVDVVYDGEDGLYYAQNGDYDVVVLDVMMPRMNGYEVVQRLRQNKNNVPVLMLTAKDDVSARVKGLDYGADDYLTKPFATEELLALRKGACTPSVGNDLRYHQLQGYNLKHFQLQTGMRKQKRQSRRKGIRNTETVAHQPHAGNQQRYHYIKSVGT